MKIECDNATKFAEEKFKYVKEYFSQNREKQEKNEIYIWEELLALAIKGTDPEYSSDEEIIELLKYLAWRMREDRFRYKGYTAAESDVHDLTFKFEDMIHDTLSYGDDKCDYYIEYDLCEVRGEMALKIKVLKPDEPTSPVRFEFLQPNNSFEKMVRLNSLSKVTSH